MPLSNKIVNRDSLCVWTQVLTFLMLLGSHIVCFAFSSIYGRHINRSSKVDALPRLIMIGV